MYSARIPLNYVLRSLKEPFNRCVTRAIQNCESCYMRQKANDWGCKMDFGIHLTEAR